MEKSAGAMMGGTGSTRSSPSLSLIEMVDPHPPKVILTRWVKPRITLPIAFDTYRLRSRVGLADAIPRGPRRDMDRTRRPGAIRKL
jgi:hypothetical protein